MFRQPIVEISKNKSKVLSVHKNTTIVKMNPIGITIEDLNKSRKRTPSTMTKPARDI